MMGNDLGEYEELREELENQKKISTCLAQQRDDAKKFADQLLVENAELILKSDDYILPLESLENIRDIRQQGNYDKSRRQILVIGYYGEDNYGDELMLDCLLKDLRRDDVQIWIALFPAPRYHVGRWKGCRCLYLPKSEEGILDCACFFDELVLGGGAHIDDIEIRDPTFIPYLARRLSLLMLRRAKRVRWIAVSSNRCIENQKCIKELNTLLREGAMISVRDHLSLKTLSEAGVDVSAITLAKDPALSIVSRKTLLVVLAGLEIKERLKSIVFDLATFCRKSSEDWELCFVPFLNVRHHDLNLIKEVCAEVDLTDVVYYTAPEFTSIESMTLYFKAADLVFSMKYHASLLALHYRKPLVTYCLEHRHYFNKMHALHEYFGNKYILDALNYSHEALLLKLAEA